MSNSQSFKIITSKFNCDIQVKNGLIIKAGLFLNNFKGQYISDLMDWLDEYFTDDYKVESI